MTRKIQFCPYKPIYIVMKFEKAEWLSFTIHMIIAVGLGLWGFLLPGEKAVNGITGAIIYIVAWKASYIFFNGCILSYIENWISLRLYNRRFHSHYETRFHSSPCAKLLKRARRIPLSLKLWVYYLQSYLWIKGITFCFLQEYHIYLYNVYIIK